MDVHTYTYMKDSCSSDADICWELFSERDAKLLRLAAYINAHWRHFCGPQRASTTSSDFSTRWTISWAIHYVSVANSFNIGAISKTTYSWDTFCSDSSASARHSWYNGSLMGGMAHEFSENNPYRTSSILINSPNAQFNWLLDPPSHIEKCRAARKIK